MQALLFKTLSFELPLLASLVCHSHPVITTVTSLILTISHMLAIFFVFFHMEFSYKLHKLISL